MQIYDELMTLCNDSDNLFFYKDFKTPLGTDVRIFGYHFVSYTDWLKPSALECRGIMFRMDKGEAVEILTRPMAKFFNLNENPMTTGLDLSKIEFFMDKADGSLVSTYLDQGEVYMKSKMSIFSDQANWANAYLNDWDHRELKSLLKDKCQNGFTFNFEYVAPHNRVVLGYQTTRMILLNVRDNTTGEYVPYEELYGDPILRKYLVPAYTVPEDTTGEDFIAETYQKTGIEGYVFKLTNGLFFKVKTEWYSELHNVKASLHNNRALMTLARHGVLDDVRALFTDDWSLTKINTFEKTFLNYLTESLQVIRDIHKKHHGKDRKFYAIGGQTDLTELGRPHLFGLYMQLFNGMLSTEILIESISDVFIKYVDNFIPEEYRDTTKT